jgi:hypothetical protein
MSPPSATGTSSTWKPPANAFVGVVPELEPSKPAGVAAFTRGVTRGNVAPLAPPELDPELPELPELDPTLPELDAEAPELAPTLPELEPEPITWVSLLDEHPPPMSATTTTTPTEPAPVTDRIIPEATAVLRRR